MARARQPSVSQAPEEAVASSGDANRVTVRVRSIVFRRYRAGLGPITREPMVVEVTPEQLASLKGDPLLIVEEA